MVRPGDANETAYAWKTAPRAISKQRPDRAAPDPPGHPGAEGTSADGVAKGGYVLAEASTPSPDVVLIGTGSELQLAVAARETLEAQGVATRVVSMPCVEWFEEQDQDYRDQVLPPTVTARVAVEAGIAMPWYQFVGGAGEIVSIEHFGESADYKTLFREFGFTPEARRGRAAQRSLTAVKG